jgi:AcrR family transcriptional regulator
MPESRTIRLRAPERRSTILEAAGRLFGDRGYDATTLEEVASAAGVTKPIVYRHFGSKEGLYLALLERHHLDLPTLAAQAAPNEPLAHLLREALTVWLDYVESHSYAWKMLFRDTGGGLEIEQFRRVVSTRAREVLAALLRTHAQGSIPPEEVEPLAELMRSGMASLVLWWLEHPATPRAVITDALMRVWGSLL